MSPSRIWLWRAVLAAGFLLAWEVLTRIEAVGDTPGLTWLDPFFISRPSSIALRFIELSSFDARVSIWRLAWSTTQSTLLGLAVGIATGFAAGIVLGRSDRAALVCEPFIVAANSLPRIALVPIVTMIFGFGLLAKVVLAWSIVFFIVFFNTFQGARSVDADLVHSARFLGASQSQILRTVVIPATLAWTFASLTPAVSFALVGVLVGELIGGESGGGLGYLIVLALATLDATDMMVALVAVGAIGVALAAGMRRVERRLLLWRVDESSSSRPAARE